MAYCRWSDCDAYVYEDATGGWTTHIAGYRNPAGYPPPFDFSSDESIARSIEAQNEWREKNNSRAAIGLPEDGMSFNHDSPGACADNLRRLKAMGYDIPDDVIAELEEEQREMDKESS